MLYVDDAVLVASNPSALQTLVIVIVINNKRLNSKGLTTECEENQKYGI